MQPLRLETAPAAPLAENIAALDPCFLRHLLPADLGSGVCVEERKGPALGLFAARYGCPSVRAWGVLPAQRVSLALVAHAEGELRANGLECSRHSLLVFGEASPVFLCAEGPLTIVAVQMGRSALPSAWQGALSDTPSEPSNFLMASLPPMLAQHWAQVLGREAGLSDPTLPGPASALQVENEIGQLLAALPAPARLAMRVRRPAQARRQALLAVELGKDYDAETRLAVPALMQHLDVRRRTLEYEIDDLTGMSPHAWLTALRLDRVRVGLMHRDTFARVGDIATRWGFSHQGRFARAYCERFGELPSITAARAALRLAANR